MKTILVEDHLPSGKELRDMPKCIRPAAGDDAVAMDAVERLPQMLEQHSDAALVITDLDLPVRAGDGSQSKPTRLQSLIAVQQSLDARPTFSPQTAVITSGTGDNRLWLTLAAFQLMRVAPIDYLARSRFSDITYKLIGNFSTVLKWSR